MSTVERVPAAQPTAGRAEGLLRHAPRDTLGEPRVDVRDLKIVKGGTASCMWRRTLPIAYFVSPPNGVRPGGDEL